MHGGLVERRGDDRVNLPGQSQIAGAEDIVHSGRSGGGALLADRDAVGRRVLQVEQRHASGLVGARFRIRDNGELREVSEPARGSLQDAPIPDHEWPAALEDNRMGQCLHHDLGTDPGRIAHGDRQQGSGVFTHADRVPESLMRRPPCRRRSAHSENARHLVRCTRTRALHDDRIASRGAGFLGEETVIGRAYSG
ncbi:MAG: hypothetical protein K0Q89_2392 [Thermomicrobiales bacterium]|nr:hypothetical protein [Thermomicrobiales bacterium]